MSLLNAAENLIFNTKEKKRKYIYCIFNDYEEYINREKLSLKEDLSQDKKLMIIVNIAVAYYNKFALFPLFPCLATGNMSGIY